MRRGMKLDLGGVAKLPILEAGMRVLKSHGLDGAMINGGGDVLVTGQLDAATGASACVTLRTLRVCWAPCR